MVGLPDMLNGVFHYATILVSAPQESGMTEQIECLGNNAEYPLVLGCGAFAVRELLGQVEPRRLLGQSESLRVAPGGCRI